VGQRVIADRFEIERIAGEGGMSTVFRALDRASGQIVALKLVDVASADVDRFDREAKLLARLEHPAIVRYVAHGGSAEGPYLAMQWLEGEDLATRLGRGPLSVDETLILARRISEALGHAHALGIVHRDVKPSNVFLPNARFEQAVLVDFGVARVLSTTPSVMTKTGLVLGTIQYMAPEQARGDKDLDARADVFALGCLLFECLVGRPAFDGQHAVAVLAKILFEDPPRLEELGIPRNVSRLVEAMLSKDPQRRPRDGHGVIGFLETTSAAPLARDVDRSPRLSPGEQRLVSVILVASAEKADAAAPTLSSNAEHGALAACRDVVAPYGARLEALADGSVVVLLEAQSATDLARNAARCALALRRLRLDCSVSLTTGRAVTQGQLPMGEAIDRAAVLVQATNSGVSIDDTTAGLLDARFEVRDHVLYEERSTFDVARTVLGKQTACVGRERELALIAGVFAESRAEPGARVVIVTAPAGAGKSRVRYELMHRTEIASAHPETFIGRGEAIAVNTPFTILGGALRDNIGIGDGDAPELRRQKLWARVSRNVPPADVVRIAEMLGEIVGVHTTEPESAELRAARTDAKRMQTEIGRAFVDFIFAEAGVGAVLVVIEDLHWAAAHTIDVLDQSLEACRDRPLFLLALTRPEAHTSLWKRHEATEIALPPLGRKACERLVRDVLGANASAEVVERLVTLGGGNALHLEELIRAAAEGRNDAVPGSVLAMIQSSLERLDDEARRVMRAASVFGKIFSSGGVAKLSGSSADATLARLVEREVLMWQGDAFTFRHDLLREASYLALTEADRRLGHGLAAEWLVSIHEGKPMVIVEHLVRAEDVARILDWLREWDKDVYLSRVAPMLDEVTNRLLPALRADSDRCMAHIRLAAIACGVHRYALAREHLEVATPLANERKLESSVRLVRAQVHARMGDFSSAARELKDIEYERLDGEGAHRYDIIHAQNLAATGCEADALETLERARNRVTAGDVRALVEIEKNRSIIAYFCGRFDVACDAGERHVALAKAAKMAYEVAVGKHNLAENQLWLGDPERAKQTMTEALEIAREHGFHRLLAHDQMFLIYMNADDRAEDAIPALLAALETAESRNYLWDALNGRFLLAKLCVRAKSPQAKAVLESVIERASQLKNGLVEREARGMLTELQRST